MPKDHQIGGWQRPSEKAALEEYLDQFGIGHAAAATLLFVRELRCNRLSMLKDRFAVPTGSDRKRITVHQPDGGLKTAFKEHAASIGLKPNAAASILLRAELSERWLEKAMESC
jgi:hypothetical protein